MSDERTITLAVWVSTNIEGSETSIETEVWAPSHLAGDDLRDFCEAAAREAMFEMIEWGFEIEDAADD